MKSNRVLSTATDIYHKPGCRYTKQIYNRNKMELLFWEAREYGYRPCKCCNTMVFLYDVEKDSLCRMESEWGLRFQMRDGILYVQTSISCWKLVYSKKEEKIALYHRNSSDKPVDFKKPQYEQYHRQKDCPNGNSISKMCRYLYEHDRYREAQQKGIQLTTFFDENQKGKDAFYISTKEETINGMYYRVIVAYQLKRRIIGSRNYEPIHIVRISPLTQIRFSLVCICI